MCVSVGFLAQDTEHAKVIAPNFPWLTNNVGYPKLREHLDSVVAIMKLSDDWHDFRAKLERLHPPIGRPTTQLAMEFADEKEEDTGKGL